MALNFDPVIIQAKNVSFENLSLEKFDETDVETNTITFKDLFEDHLATIRRRNSHIMDESLDGSLFDVESTGIDNILDFDLDVFESNESNLLLDNKDVSLPDTKCIDDNGFSNIKKKKVKTMRQSTRIENQTRKKIADQIQRENVRLAMEAQLLNNTDYVVQESNIFYINGKPASPATQRYMSLPTDLDAEEEAELEARASIMFELKVDDDHIEISHKSEENSHNPSRPMISCNICLESFDRDMLTPESKEESPRNEFTCHKCKETPRVPDSQEPDTLVAVEVVTKVEREYEEGECIDDDDCLITMAEEPVKFSSNIFQIIGTNEQSEVVEAANGETVNIDDCFTSLPEDCTSPCLNKTCDSLVNRQKTLYCSRNCIDIYSKIIITNNQEEKTKEYGYPKGLKLAKMTRFVLAQPDTETIQDEYTAPTEDSLFEFLSQNPTYKVYQNVRAKTPKPKPDKGKDDKYQKWSSNDPTKHIKMVRQFATLFKKSMPLNTFNAEFNKIWKLCIRIEESLYEICDKVMEEKYEGKVKQLSEYIKEGKENRLCWFVLQDKISITEFLTLTGAELDDRLKTVAMGDDTLSTKENNSKAIATVDLESSPSEEGALTIVIDDSVPIQNGGKSKAITIDDTAMSPVDGQSKKGLWKDVAPALTETSTVDKKVFASTKSLSLFSDSTHLHGQHVYDIKCKLCVGSSKSEDDNKTKETAPETSKEKSSAGGAVARDLAGRSEPGVPVKAKCLSGPTLTPPIIDRLVSVWEGKVTYGEIGPVNCKSYLVTRCFFEKYVGRPGSPLPFHDERIRDRLDIGTSIGHSITISGRSDVALVEDYLMKLRRRSDKELVVLQLCQGNTSTDRQNYVAMFEYFYTRKRCGVINKKDKDVKDCFIYPLNGHAQIPPVFLPFIGPGFEKHRNHLLLLILVRTPVVPVPYRPISPKYDEDIVTRHGINLDKYHPNNGTQPFCSAPSVASKDVLSWVLNVRSDVNTERDHCDPATSDEQKEEIVDNNCEDTPDSSILDHETNFDDHGSETPERTTTSSKREPPESPTRSRLPQRSLSSTNSENKITTSMFLQKFADIVMNGPIKADHVNSLSETVADIISSNDRFDTSILQRMVDIVDKVKGKEVPAVQPRQTDNIQATKSNERESSPIMAEWRPVNRSPPLNNKDVCHQPEKRARFSLVDSESRCMYLKRRHSTRLYTFYDSFADEEDSREKRQRYFFNPLCDWNDPLTDRSVVSVKSCDSSPPSTVAEEREQSPMVVVVTKPKPVSVFTFLKDALESD